MTEIRGGAPPATRRVLIADDHPMVLEGLRALIVHTPELELCGVATSGRDTVELARVEQPDVAVLDLQMPELDGVAATRELLTVSPRTAVLVLTMFHDDEWILAALRAGARGYLLKGASREEILRAIAAVGDGQSIFGPAVAERVLASFAEAGRGAGAGVGAAATGALAPGATAGVPDGLIATLTGREREVLELVAAGLANRAIAQRLFLSPKTVRNHVSNIFTKIGVGDRSQAIVVARDAGLGRGPAAADRGAR